MNHLTRERSALAVITALGLVLRLYGLDTDLWIDEIGSFQHAMSVPIAELFRTFSSPNQHLLNSLLERLSVALLGEHDWTIRLPAVVFGIATVPAMYWLARPIMRAWQSLAVALLTAVSYHHIWFSQNARGYSAYLLFCVLATACFARLLADERPRWGALYIVTAALSLLSLVISAFVVATHAILAVAVVVRRRRRGEDTAALVRRLVATFIGVGVAGAVIYGPTAVEVLRVVGKAYVREGTGFRPVSLEFVTEVLRGLGAGFGPLALVGALPFLVLVGIGTLRLLRRAPVVTLSFVVPLALTAAVVVAAGWLTSPRFFLIVLPFALLVAVESFDVAATTLSRLVHDPAKRERVRRASTAAMTVATAAALAFGLPRYYAVPKQSYRAAIHEFRARAGADDVLIAVYMADRGFDYYVRRLGLGREGRFYSARTVEDFDALRRRLATRRITLATTLDRAFQLEAQPLWARVVEGWAPARTFPATVGYGEITLWVPRDARSETGRLRP